MQNFLLGRFCTFVFEHSLTSCMTFSHSGSSFLSDLFCSRYEIKFIAKIGRERMEIKANVADW